MANKCRLCEQNGPPIYTTMDYKMVPMCLDCYKKNRKPAKNKYKKLMNKLSNMGYVWVLNVGDIDFPFTFFGLEVSFYQIVQHFFKYIDSDKYSLLSQEDYAFDFDDYADPIITETSITFINDETQDTYTVNIRMGVYNYKEKELLFFTDKQLGYKKSNLENYASFVIGTDGELTEVVPDFESSFVPPVEYYDEEIYSKPYFDEEDLHDLVGFKPDFPY